MKKIILVMLIVLLGFSSRAFAAVGCSLNDPDRDVKRLFPQSSSYKTTFITIKERGGEGLKKEIEGKLQDKFDDIYENIDVPYAYYTVLKGKDPIGYIHGVNQKGKYGGLQLILATDLEGKIRGFYFQKISSPEAAKFIKEEFSTQFIGLTLADFYDGQNSRLVRIKDPTDNSHEDFKATLRGIKKSLILLDTFLLKKSDEAVYQRTGGGK